jgi:5'-methylthioadenosine/S-adenosylhomocysteine nucleosidase
MSIAVLIAMPVEAAALIEDPRFCWKKVEDGFFHSTSGMEPISLIITGVGKVNATWGLARAIYFDSYDAGSGYVGNTVMDTRNSGNPRDNPRDRAPHVRVRVREKPRLVFSLGTSGALDATPVGTMILCDEFVEHDMDVTALGYPPGVTPNAKSTDPIYHSADSSITSIIEKKLFEAGVLVRHGRQLSGDLFLGNAEAAERKYSIYGSSDATLIDMECAAIAKICATTIKIPYLAIRYVSDNADHNAGTSWDTEVGKAAKLLDGALAAIAF